MDTPTLTIIDCATGETITRNLTEQELAEMYDTPDPSQQKFIELISYESEVD
jgi:hypothetical protein